MPERGLRSYSASETVIVSLARYVHPALFTRMSSLPSLVLAKSSPFLQSASTVTFIEVNSAAPPSRPISAATLVHLSYGILVRQQVMLESTDRCPFSSSISAMITLAPSCAKSFAIPSPKPKMFSGSQPSAPGRITSRRRIVSYHFLHLSPGRPCPQEA